MKNKVSFMILSFFYNPTSPFRKVIHVKEALELYNTNLDMVISVKETESNPYYLLCEEDDEGFLVKSKQLSSGVTRRQDAPKVWQYNGALYIINTKSILKLKQIRALKKVIKYEMSTLNSVDLDTSLDWSYAEFLVEKGFVTL